MSERWLPVVGLENRYEVSNLGRVRNLKTGRVRKKQKGVYLLFGYRTEQRKYKTIAVHKMVMEAFVGPCPDGHEVNHRDGNKHNARLDNLEYVTKSENSLHSYHTGLQTHSRGDNWCRSKLSEEAVVAARAARAAGARVVDLAKTYGVNKATMCEALKGRTWGHVKGV